MGRGVTLSHQDATRTEGFYCPCVDCGNVGMVNNIGSLREHIFRRGFRQHYYVWVSYGEEGIYDGGNAVVNDVHERGEFDVIENDKNLEDECENIEDDDDDGDHVEKMMEGVDDHAGKRPRIFECMDEASRKPLYPGCTRYSKLTAVITLFNIKTKAGISYSAFTSLLQAFGDMLSDDHELPKSNYYAKKLMCPFGLEYQRIHACPNDCVLYRNEYTDIDECPRCGKSRYRRAGVGDKKGPPAKVMWYLPIIPRFKRMFSIKKDAKNLRWHSERRTKDGFLKHPTDAPKWKGINRLHKTFAGEDRNLRLGLCTDGMNPFGNLSSQDGTWPVLLVIYNLPPWFCMKWKYIMLSILISGPKQPRIDIDVYLQPLVDDLRKMWDEGVSVYDAHADENKGKKACPICIDDTESKHISTCHKEVYMRTRRFLRRDHPYCNKKKAFDGTVEEGVARRPLTGVEVFDQVKGMETIFGKGADDGGKGL
ncbi:uncharacterized protein LOC125493794 [Beta vulgaris subsp. vulgaris]|uniref:uncharacterized protein LOC125493794 n=1 Tax=Beta vulgaris subsp. vulgaris TaxID=3555 RepID=UPI002036B72B|nr:uncharacterized protein LOC125493794 [Beta vulgaris subsp. vulgaris]